MKIRTSQSAWKSITMTFTEWLVANNYATSEDRETIESELSGPEADALYEQYLNEGNEE